jgi:predicted nucleic acid-binding protein
MFTVDASVHINALNPTETGSAESQVFLTSVYQQALPVYSPTLLWVEVAAALARVFDNSAQGIALAQALRILPGHIWVPLDEELAGQASVIAAEYRLRGADAVYAAVARRYQTTLVTNDQQQIDRLRSFLSVCLPADVPLPAS